MSRQQKRYILIPAIITAIVMICFGLFAYAFISGFTAQLAPSSGTWYSEELCLQLSFDPDGQSVWHTQGGDIPCTFYSHPQDAYIPLREIQEIITADEGIVYRDGDRIMVFHILEYEDNRMVVQDYFQNEYTFSQLP